MTEIARVAGVSTATVDRVLNGRGGVREKTRLMVLEATRPFEKRPGAPEDGQDARPVIFLSESGTSFNEALGEAIAGYAAAHGGVRCSYQGFRTSEADPNAFADLIHRSADMAAGIVVVAREHVAVNRAIRAVQARGVPVVCVTTDLPNSNRAAYVGSDQAGAGATAAYLMGRALGERKGKILLVISAPYRCQEDREVGFRRVLRSEFNGLTVDERVNSNDEVEFSYRNVREYVADHGPPLGVYNVAGGNRGIADALRDEGLLGSAVFIGHEMTRNTRHLLESDAMDFAIGHDLDLEVAISVEAVQRHREAGGAMPFPFTPVRIFTKFNCS